MQHRIYTVLKLLLDAYILFDWGGAASGLAPDFI